MLCQDIGGAERRCHEVACGLAAASHQIRLVTEVDVRDLAVGRPPAGLTYDVRPALTVGSLRQRLLAWMALMLTLRWEGTRSVLVSVPELHRHRLLVLMLGACFRSRVVFRFGLIEPGPVIDPVTRRCYAFAARRGATGVFVSNENLKRFCRRMRARPAQAQVIYSAPAPRPPVRSASAEAFRADLHEDCRLLLCCGGLSERKRFAHAVALCACLRDRVEAQVHLLWIGDGDKAADFHACVAQHGVADRVHHIRSTDDPESYMRVANVFVHCSRAEGMSGAAVEAARVGLPIVAYAVGGLPELMRIHGHGLLVDDGDQEALAEAVERCLHMERRRDTSAVAKVFSNDIMVARFGSLLEQH